MTELRHREVRFETNPRFLDWGPMWRVSRGPLARALGRPPGSLDPFFEELGPLHQRLIEEAGRMPSAGALMQAPLLYVVTRACRPRWVVETGISSGFSARLFLEALVKNGGGHLDSIGVEAFGIAMDRSDDAASLTGRRVGWLVPDSLKPNWTLHLGTSQERLPPLLAGTDAPIDLFLHDSKHDHATMQWEYRAAWPRLAAGGILASHDVHANSAWPEFLGERGLSGSGAEVDHDLGIVVRPATEPTGTSPRTTSG